MGWGCSSVQRPQVQSPALKKGSGMTAVDISVCTRDQKRGSFVVKHPFLQRRRENVCYFNSRLSLWGIWLKATCLWILPLFPHLQAHNHFWCPWFNLCFSNFYLWVKWFHVIRLMRKMNGGIRIWKSVHYWEVPLLADPKKKKGIQRVWTSWHSARLTLTMPVQSRWLPGRAQANGKAPVFWEAEVMVAAEHQYFLGSAEKQQDSWKALSLPSWRV